MKFKCRCRLFSADSVVASAFSISESIICRCFWNIYRKDRRHSSTASSIIFFSLSSRLYFSQFYRTCLKNILMGCGLVYKMLVLMISVALMYAYCTAQLIFTARLKAYYIQNLSFVITSWFALNKNIFGEYGWVRFHIVVNVINQLDWWAKRVNRNCQFNSS
jgi:hypothetical protein